LVDRRNEKLLETLTHKVKERNSNLSHDVQH
jgi:hypothetical protein